MQWIELLSESGLNMFIIVVKYTSDAMLNARLPLDASLLAFSLSWTTCY